MRVITSLVQKMAMWTDTLQVIVPACRTIRYVKRVLTNLNMLALKEDIKAFKERGDDSADKILHQSRVLE